MTHSDPSDVHVLVVDDEEDVTEIFCHWLNEKYTAHAVTNGHDALEYLEENPHINIVLLDRRMPSIDGDEVLKEIRNRELDCMVAMITAVDPTINIVDMDFDDYLTKPADRDDLYAVVESLLTRYNYSTQLGDYYSLLAKRSALQEELPEHQLQDMEKYNSLQSQISTLQEELEDEIDFSSHDNFVSALQDATDRD